MVRHRTMKNINSKTNLVHRTAMEEIDEREYDELLEGGWLNEPPPTAEEVESATAAMDCDDDEVSILEPTPAPPPESPAVVTVSTLPPPPSSGELGPAQVIVSTETMTNPSYSSASSENVHSYTYSKYGMKSYYDSGENHSETDFEKPTMSSTYYQCKSARQAKNTCEKVVVSIGEDTCDSSVQTPCRIGSLDCMGDTEILRTFRGSRITSNSLPVNQNISCTFDPANLTCVVCPNPHKILAKGREDSPPILIFSDQNFVSTLCGGNSCVAIARLEDASLTELGDIALEMLDRHIIPAGTIFAFGSASNLHISGTTIYASDWCKLVGRLSARYSEIRIIPLIPILREDCPGILGRQLLELKTWFERMYNNTQLGMSPIWQMFVDHMKKTDEDGFDFGFTEVYTVGLPSSLLPGSSLIPYKFCISSSHTATKGLGSEASYELLRAFLDLLMCNFATHANSDEIFAAAPAEQKGDKEPSHYVLLGGSNLKKIGPLLAKMGFGVTDLTKPGWIPSPPTVTALLSEILPLSLPENTVFITDMLGNVAYRSAQLDGTLAMPYKISGRYHIEGEVHLCSKENLCTLIDNLKPVLEKISSSIVFLAPLPRYLYNGCCTASDHCTNISSPTHASELLKKVVNLRQTCKDHLNKIGIRNFWVPDTMGAMMPACTGHTEYTSALAHLVAADGVHLTDSGYQSLTTGLVSCSNQFAKPNQTVTGPACPIPGTSREKSSYYWRGFVSPIGTGRPKNHAAAYLAVHGGRGKNDVGNGGGRWRGGRGDHGGRGARGHFHPYGGKPRY